MSVCVCLMWLFVGVVVVAAVSRWGLWMPTTTTTTIGLIFDDSGGGVLCSTHSLGSLGCANKHMINIFYDSRNPNT